MTTGVKGSPKILTRFSEASQKSAVSTPCSVILTSAYDCETRQMSECQSGFGGARLALTFVIVSKNWGSDMLL